MPPVCLYTPIHLYAPCTFRCPLMPPYVQTPPICPQCTPVHLYVLGVSACDRGMQGTPYVWTPPYVWMPPHVYYAPLHVYVLEVIYICYGGNTPYVGGLGVSAHLSGIWCVSTSIGCPLCFILYLPCSSLCLKSLLHGYNYYSSSDCCVFWYVICIISDHGFLFDGDSYNAGSA